MAYVRHKESGGKRYYQMIISYRNKEGKPRQKMICYLGKHRTVKVAIAHEKRKEATENRAADSWLRDAAHWRKVFEPYGQGLISDEEMNAKRREFRKARQQVEEDFYNGRLSLEEANEKVKQLRQKRREEIGMPYNHYKSLEAARESQERAAKHRAKLDKLLAIQQEYF